MRVASAGGRSAQFPRRLLPTLIVLSLAALCSACSSGRKPMHPVRGQVLLEGKPVSGALVTFYPVGGTPEDPRPSGQTNEQGYFILTSYAGADGAPEGEYGVAVTCFRSFTVGKAEGDETTHNVLPARYAAPATSQLKATVSKGRNEIPPFQVRAH
jgi:hypothetical protein